MESPSNISILQRCENACKAQNISQRCEYINSKGKPVEVAITDHALHRFRQRWVHAFPNKGLANTQEVLVKWFTKAKRINPTGREYRERLLRYGDDTLFFQADPFVFVIQAGVVKTVELGTRELRSLNKATGSANDRYFPSFWVTCACSMDAKSSTIYVPIGTYDSAESHGNIRCLRYDSGFKAEVVKRFREKRLGWTLRKVMAKIGRNGKEVVIFDEGNAPGMFFEAMAPKPLLVLPLEVKAEAKPKAMPVSSEAKPVEKAIFFEKPSSPKLEGACVPKPEAKPMFYYKTAEAFALDVLRMLTAKPVRKGPRIVRFPESLSRRDLKPNLKPVIGAKPVLTFKPGGASVEDIAKALEARAEWEARPKG